MQANVQRAAKSFIACGRVGVVLAAVSTVCASLAASEHVRLAVGPGVGAERRSIVAQTYHFKVGRSLVADGFAIAVQADEKNVQRVIDQLAQQQQASKQGEEAKPEGQGKQDIIVMPHAVAGWCMVESNDAAKIASLRDALAGANVFSSFIYTTQEAGKLFATPSLLVRFREGVTADASTQLLTDAAAGKVISTSVAGMERVWRYELATRDGHDALAIAAKLAQRDETEFAELDCVISGGGTVSPNDPLFGECWGLNNIGQSGGTPDIDMDVLEAWDITTGSNNIVVLVMDTGTDLAHPDMPVAFGRDFTGAVPSSGGPQNTCDSHGTAVAGCISALVNNNTGAAGVAPGTRLATARPFVSNSACDGSWSAAFSWTADALEWGRGLGARVSNNSNYFGGTSSIVTAKYNDTYATGMVHFASAGNNNNATIVYPANIPVVNAVMAITRTGARAGFSSFGVGVDFAAPGVAIRTTDRVSSLGYSVTDYALVNGTSFASPYAAGVAALLLSQNPSLTPAEVETAMRNTAMDLGSAGYDTTFGYGLVRALAALQAVGACDDIDFNNDGLFPDDTDLLDFLSVLAGGTCSTGACNDIDFNNDSLFPDDADLLAFLSVLAGQACN